MSGEIYKNDIGTAIILDSGSDISLATIKKIKYEKPNEAKGEWEDGVEIFEVNKLKYFTKNGDLNQVGTWTVQIYVELPAWKGHGEKAKFVVHDFIVVD